MTNEEFFSLIEATEIKGNAVSEVESSYNLPLPELIKKIVSVNEENVFVDDKRLLSVKEIISADKELGTDFVQRKLLPLFDAMDNDFIVYDLQRDTWGMFNIVDQCLFGKKDSLKAYFD